MGEDPSCFKCLFGACDIGGFCGVGQDFGCKKCDQNNFCTLLAPFGAVCSPDGNIKCDGYGKCTIGLA
jgi:hypothetical protein